MVVQTSPCQCVAAVYIVDIYAPWLLHVHYITQY